MMTKLKRIICCALALCGLAGCRLALEDTGESTYGDRLIGVYITAEHLDLFDAEAYLNDNISGIMGGGLIKGDTRKYQGRVYATLTWETKTSEETGESYELEDYIFEGLDGIGYFAPRIPATAERESYFGIISDDGVSDAKSHIFNGDDEDELSLEATVYFVEGRGNSFYFNPVYQSADGSVYLYAGTGISVQGVRGEGSSMSTTIDDTKTITENGETKTYTTSVKFTITSMYAPEQVSVLQMNADSELISREEYVPGALPEDLTPSSEAAYLIVETLKHNAEGDAEVSRDIYGKNDEAVTTFVPGECGVCLGRSTRIKWADGAL